MSGGVPQIDGFEDLTVLARGGFSTVYRARQPSAGRYVAIKVLDDVLVSEETRRRFERECQTLGAVAAHPGICTLHSSGQTAQGHPYLVLELCTGTLADQVSERGPLPADEAVAVLIGLAEALGVAHERGIVHRDVKPQNVLVTQFGQLVLTDFGIARTADGFHTSTGLVTASVAHAAPEVLDGDPPTVRSDVWSLASTGYQLLTGSAPFRRPDEPSSAMISRIFRDPPPDLRERGVPEALAGVLEAALAKAPADRTPDMASFAAALRAALQVRGPATRAARADPDPERTSARVVPGAAPMAEIVDDGATRWWRRHQRALRIGLIGIGTVVAIALLLTAGPDSPLVDYDDPTLDATRSSETTEATATTTTTEAPPAVSVDPQESFCVRRTDGHLVIRTGPGTRFAEVAEIPEGRCTVRDAQEAPQRSDPTGRWRYVEWEGQVGWVSDRYLDPATG